MASILEVDFAVDTASPNEDVYKILKTLRPNWKSDEIKLKELAGGLANKVYCISCLSHPDDMIGMKVFLGASATLNNHDMVLQFLTQHTDILQLYCRFPNGFMYKFYPGRMATVADIKGDSTRRQIYEKLHQLHAVDLPDDMENDAQQYDAMYQIIEKSVNVLRSDKAAILDKNERFLSAGLPQRVLIDIGEKVLQDYKALRESQPNMLCHGDTRMHNIVINEKTGEVHWIDWDITGVGMEVLDLAVFLGWDPLKTLYDANLLPYQDEELMDKWLMLYLETHPQYKGKDVGQDVFRKWKRLVLETFDILLRFSAIICVAFAVGFDDTKFPGEELCIDTLATVPTYKEMLQKMDKNS